MVYFFIYNRTTHNYNRNKISYIDLHLLSTQKLLSIINEIMISNNWKLTDEIIIISSQPSICNNINIKDLCEIDNWITNDLDKRSQI